MCCGVGNLEVKHSNPRNIYMSTLDQADIDVMKATKTCVSAERFQYDYLNDDIDDFGNIDYSLTNKIPISLQNAIKESRESGGKKILILMNPPYAEAANSDNASSEGEAGAITGVSKTNIGSLMNRSNYGYASRELFVQFVARIQEEIPNATLAMFSTLKYINAPNFEEFRIRWKAKFLDGFIIHSKAFDGLSGNFPIGFLIWDLASKDSIDRVNVQALDKNSMPIGDKWFYNIPATKYLSSWLVRPRANNQDVVPLKNTITPATATKDLRGTKWADGAIGCMFFQGNDIQHSSNTTLLSSGFGSAGSFFVTPENLWQAAIMFAVRLLIKPTCIIDRYQFLQPTVELPDEFKNDCLVYMLLNLYNKSASANDLDWNNKKWSIVNHFIPFTEAEVSSPERFESDFMVQYLSDKELSPEAQAVLDAGRTLWKVYFSETDVHVVREEFKLNRPDVGWYQIRNALGARNKSGDYQPISFELFEEAYKALGDKLRPQVYELGFLR
jgi:hypothetical protein